MAERMFPVMGLSNDYRQAIRDLRAGGTSMIVIALPWSLIAPHEAQARSNHGGQTLERLAQRGGLGPDEAVAVLEDRRWHKMDRAEANQALVRILATQA